MKEVSSVFSRKHFNYYLVFPAIVLWVHGEEKIGKRVCWERWKESYVNKTGHTTAIHLSMFWRINNAECMCIPKV